MGGGWDDLRFESSDCSIEVEYLLRDQSDPTGMTFYRDDTGVDWGTIINSRTLRVIGFELEVLDSNTNVGTLLQNPKLSTGTYNKSRYEPGVRYTMAKENHEFTLNSCLQWTPNPALDASLEELEQAEEEEGDAAMETS